MMEGIDSGCAAHPTVPAAGSCKQCARHYCTKCMVSAPFGRFCSVDCRDQYHDFVNKAEANEANSPKKRSIRLGPIIRKIVVIVIAVGFLGVAASLVQIPILSGVVHTLRGIIGI